MRQQSGTTGRILLKTVIWAIVLLVAASCRSPEKTSAPFSLEKQSNRVLLIGHRGAAGLLPENTLAAFQRVCEIGVDAIELDVFLTADSKIVVHHDYTLKREIARTSDGKWIKAGSDLAIHELTLVTFRINISTSWTREAMTRIKDTVWRYSSL